MSSRDENVNHNFHFMVLQVAPKRCGGLNLLPQTKHSRGFSIPENIYQYNIVTIIQGDLQLYFLAILLVDFTCYALNGK